MESFASASTKLSCPGIASRNVTPEDFTFESSSKKSKRRKVPSSVWDRTHVDQEWQAKMPCRNISECRCKRFKNSEYECHWNFSNLRGICMGMPSSRIVKKSPIAQTNVDGNFVEIHFVQNENRKFCGNPFYLGKFLLRASFRMNKGFQNKIMQCRAHNSMRLLWI